MKLELVRLSSEYRKEFSEMMEEWIEHITKYSLHESPWVIFRNDYRDFDYYAENLEYKEESPDGRVPDTTLFCIDREAGCFVGAVNIRHYLNE